MSKIEKYDVTSYGDISIWLASKQSIDFKIIIPYMEKNNINNNRTTPQINQIHTYSFSILGCLY